MSARFSCTALLISTLAIGCGVRPPVASEGTPLASLALTWNAGSVSSVYDPPGERYSYAPSVIVDGTTEHIWTCHNDVSGDIRDHIYYTRRVGGVMQESRSVLGPAPDGRWDDWHICDPSVVRSDVSYGGVSYAYVMFYLGNDRACSCNNQIGVAFAQNVGGPWVRAPDPVVGWSDAGQWGVGQPSATSVNGSGRFLLFYTQGDASGTRAVRRDVNVATSPFSIGPPLQLTNTGLTGSTGGGDYLNNFDVAYDPSRDRFYAVREQHPYPTADPAYIGESLQIVSLPGSNVWNGGGTWTVEGQITPGTTGFARNHNGGLKRNAYGGLLNAGQLGVVFTDSCQNCGMSLWSYDLWQVNGTLN
jgi:hypothetical protein